MTNDSSMGRRVTRLENDTESIYELITEVRSTQGEHTRRFAGIDSTLAEHTRRFDCIESTLAEVVRRLPEPS